MKKLRQSCLYVLFDGAVSNVLLQFDEFTEQCFQQNHDILRWCGGNRGGIIILHLSKTAVVQFTVFMLLT